MEFILLVLAVIMANALLIGLATDPELQIVVHIVPPKKEKEVAVAAAEEPEGEPGAEPEEAKGKEEESAEPAKGEQPAS